MPAAAATAGVQGLWLVDRDAGQRRAADPGRNRPKPTGSHRYEVHAQVSGAAVPA